MESTTTKKVSYSERFTLFNEDKKDFENQEIQHEFEIDTTIPKLGLMVCGWGGNNGCTLTAGIIANRNNVTWRTK